MTGELWLIVNGRQVVSRVAPRLKGASVFLPVRAVVESCGGTVEYLAGPPAQAVAALGETRLEMAVGATTARVGGRQVHLPAAPEVVEGTMLVPEKALSHLKIGTAFDATATAVLCGVTDSRLSGHRIFLDPAHGGADPGATGPSGVREADVTLEVARETAQILRLAGAIPYLSRSSDRTRSLPARVAAADARRAEIFISIHCNAFHDPKAHGTETYFHETWEGHKLAASIQQELMAELRLTDRGVKEASYYVLRHVRVPACLAELAFITNPQEEALLANPRVRLQAALAIFRGARSFLESGAARLS